MKFSTAWAQIAAQNVSLKVAAVLLAIISVAQLIIISQMAMKNPLVVERSCLTQILSVKELEPNPDEIIAFIKDVLPSRFSSTEPLKPGTFSLEESLAKEKELTALKQRQIEQRVLVNEVIINEKNISASADRLVSIGKIKSVLPLKLKISIQQTDRTEANPYGLIISTISQVPEKEEK